MFPGACRRQLARMRRKTTATIGQPPDHRLHLRAIRMETLQRLVVLSVLPGMNGFLIDEIARPRPQVSVYDARKVWPDRIHEKAFAFREPERQRIERVHDRYARRRRIGLVSIRQLNNYAPARDRRIQSRHSHGPVDR